MGFDPFSPLTAAVVNVLCLPATSIKPERLSEVVDALRDAQEKSISRDTGSQHSATANGKILLNISTSLPASVFHDIYPFENNRSPQVLLGLVEPAQDGSRTHDDEVLRQFIQKTAEVFRSHVRERYTTAIKSQLIILETDQHLQLDDTIFWGMSPEERSADRLLDEIKASLVKEIPLMLRELPETAYTIPQLLEQPNTLDGARRNRLSLRSTGRSIQEGQNGITSTANISTSPQEPDVAGIQHQTEGRKLIIQGQLRMQIGSWTKALQILSEGARSARDCNDIAWFAKALEMILCCMLLLASSRTEFGFPQNCYPMDRNVGFSGPVDVLADANKNVAEAFAPGRAKSSIQALNATLLGLIASIASLYDSATRTTEQSLPLLLVYEARIRLLNVTIILRRNGCCLSTTATQQLLGAYNGTPKPTATSDLAILDLPVSTLTRILIGTAEEAQTRLQAKHALPVLMAVTHGLSMLNVVRRQGFFLKHVLSRLASSLAEARWFGAAEMGMHPASGGHDPISAYPNHSMGPQVGIRTFLNLVTKCYGLPSAMRTPPVSTDASNLTEIDGRLSDWFNVFLSGDIAMKLEVLRLCIRVSDALPDVRTSLHFTSTLLGIVRQVVTMLPGGPHPVPLISVEEQNLLISNIKRYVDSSDKKGQKDTRAHFWDDFLLRDCKISEGSELGRLVAHSSQDLSVTEPAEGEKKRDPFIFNPFARREDASDVSVLVAGENANFLVLLQNPLEVDIEIEDIHLVADNDEFEACHHSVVLGSLCSQYFSLIGVPRRTGVFKILGCNATVRGCFAQRFFIFKDRWQPPKDIKKKQRFVTNGELQDPIAGKSPQVSAPKAIQPELSVIDPLPALRLVSTSLLQPSIMLLEGERMSFELTVQNTSHVDVDFILFTYEDSVTRQLQGALGDKDLPPAESYEIQHQVTTDPAVKYVPRVQGDQDTERKDPDSRKLFIKRDSTKTFAFEILGKAGLVEASILIDYAFLGKPRSEVSGVFYTRQLRFTTSVTVNASIDMPRCSILPLREPQNMGSKLAQHERFSKPGGAEVSIKAERVSHDACLLVLDLRNVWPQPIIVAIKTKFRDVDEDAKVEWRDAYVRTMQPGQVERATLKVPRIFVADPFAAIPSLDNKRQFVVSASRMSIEAETATRESFWYRERLLRYLKVVWTLQDGEKKGDFDIRKGVRLSTRMIDALKIDHVELTFQLKHAVHHDHDEPSSNDRAVRSIAPAHFVLHRGALAKLVVQIHNRSVKELRVILRLQPSLRNQPHNIALDLSRRFMWSGLLQQPLHPPLQPGETRQVEIGIAVLATGQYEVNATVEETEACRPQPGGDAVGDINFRAERDIWHARKPCWIDVVDGRSEFHD